MNTDKIETTDSSEDQLTGLPWPRTWKGAYLLVFACSILWMGLLILLTESA